MDQLLDNVSLFYKSSYLYHSKHIDLQLARGCNHNSGHHTHYFDCLNHYYSANGVSTPTPYQSGMSTDCDTFHLVVSGDSCYHIAADADVDLVDFYDWSPAVGDDCTSLWAGYYVCIGVIKSASTTAAASTTTSVVATTTTSGNSIATPTPHQSGMENDCSTFHEVVSGDTCYDIATDTSIELSDFYDWNPAVGD